MRVASEGVQGTEVIQYYGSLISDLLIGPAPLSPAIRSGPMLFLSGQVGIDPATGSLAATDFQGRVRQALANVQNLLASAGSHLSDVVKVTNYLTCPSDFAALNEVHESVFRPPFPARSTVGITLNDAALLYEIDVIAVRSEAGR